MVKKYLFYFAVISLIGFLIFASRYFYIPEQCALDVVSYSASISCILALMINTFVMYFLLSLIFNLHKFVFFTCIIFYILKWIVSIINVQSYIVPYQTWAPILGVVTAYISQLLILNKENKKRGDVS